MFVSGKSFQSRSGPTPQVLAPLEGRLLALPTNIRLGWKDLRGTYSLVDYENSQITAVKSFIRANVIKLFTVTIGLMS